MSALHYRLPRKVLPGDFYVISMRPGGKGPRQYAVGQIVDGKPVTMLWPLASKAEADREAQRLSDEADVSIC